MAHVNNGHAIFTLEGERDRAVAEGVRVISRVGIGEPCQTAFNRPIFGASLSEGAVAPAMGRLAGILVSRRSGVVGEGGDEHLFGPEILAWSAGLHNQAISCIKARWMSARAMGIL
jgi:hypothetical protein